MPKIIFEPNHQIVESPKGTTILEAALTHHIPIHHTCGGNASCSTCRVKILRGSESLTSIEAEEQRVLDVFDLKPPYRLSCQAMLKSGEIEIEVPDRDKEPRPNKTPKLDQGPRGTY